MNKADNEAGNAAIDSLLNYETVKVGHMINYTVIATCLSKIYNTAFCLFQYQILKYGSLFAPLNNKTCHCDFFNT